jgi:transposase
MDEPDIAAMGVEELRQLAASLLARVEQNNQEIQWKDLKISQLTHEMAVLKRWRFGRAAEEFHGQQRSLLEESIDEDLGGIEIELDQLREPVQPKKIAVRAHLPIELPRTARRKSTRAPGFQSRVQRWPSGWERAASNSSRWPMR